LITSVCLYLLIKKDEMKSRIAISSLVVLITLLSCIPTGKDTKINKRIKETPKIQVAICLDVSNSMDGLIDQTKSQLWKMVNELATSKKGEETPEIELALYEYGNSGLSMTQMVAMSIVVGQ